MPDIADALDIANHRSAAIVGSGGKTTLLWLLAQKLRILPGRRTLATTTTKIGEPPPTVYDEFVAAEALAGFRPRAGLTVSGERIAGGKLAAPPLETLLLAKDNFDHILFEADGAHERPLKGWAPYEPVVPEWTEMTVGVLPLWPVGQAASPVLVHRFPAFMRLAGIHEGETLTVSHLAAVVREEDGLFAKAQGERVLFLSVSERLPEREAMYRMAAELVRQLSADGLCGISLAVAGDARAGGCRVLWQRG